MNPQLHIDYLHTHDAEISRRAERARREQPATSTRTPRSARTRRGFGLSLRPRFA